MLAEADNLRDSIRLLYNIYDCVPEDFQQEPLEQLYQLANQRKDYRTVNDVLKQSASHYASNDSMLKVLQERAQSLPDGPEKESTLVYINVRKASNIANSLSTEQQEEKVREYLALYSRSKEYSTYKRIEYLFQLCTYLSRTTQGELLATYFRELQILIDKLPESDLTLKALFYTHAAESYLKNGMMTEAVNANKTLLTILEQIKSQCAANGHTYLNYETLAYKAYQRLLLCHRALTEDEVEEYYSNIIPLTPKDTKPDSLQAVNKQPKIYYLMAKKRYADAIPLIKELLKEGVSSREERFYLIEALLRASEKTGDKENLLLALEMSNKMLKERIKAKAAESYKDLQIVYEVNDLRHANDQLTLANQQILISRHKEQMIYSLICLVVVSILLCIVLVLYRRSRKLTSNLTKSNELIIEERDAIQQAQKELIEARGLAKEADRMKSDFVSNVGHEIRTPLELIVEYSELIANCADTDRRDVLKRSAEIIALNSDLLLTLVNDVLELPSLENAKISVNSQQSSMKKMCRAALDDVSRYISPQVELLFLNEGKPDTIIMTEPRRVGQVLHNLLMNAAKFTNRGTITLQYFVSPDQDKVSFAVTDTGTGIPDGMEDLIFSRFFKHDEADEDGCLTLYISRLIAKMLGGSLSLDKEYRGGAKFIFTIPVS